jgi:predicted AAA+ superfamily ATPase
VGASQDRKNVLDIRYWRTSTGFEVDFILGDMQLALEVKGSQNVHDAHIRALKALREEHAVEKSVVVCLEKEPRMLEQGVEVLPWQNFLEKLWAGKFGV